MFQLFLRRTCWSTVVLLLLSLSTALWDEAALLTLILLSLQLHSSTTAATVFDWFFSASPLQQESHHSSLIRSSTETQHMYVMCLSAETDCLCVWTGGDLPGTLNASRKIRSRQHDIYFTNGDQLFVWYSERWFQWSFISNETVWKMMSTEKHLNLTDGWQMMSPSGRMLQPSYK